MLCAYIFGSRYEDGAQSYAENQEDFDRENALASDTMQTVFPMWQDINVMTFIGFGLLKVFLRTNSWTAVGFNMLIACMACQWAILCYGFWQMILV